MHTDWVKGLASALMRYQIQVVYDQNEISYGEPKYTSMDNLIQSASVILIILTPGYKLKTEKRDGKGVGYEYPMILDQVYERGKKVIPVLRHPDFTGSCPCQKSASLCPSNMASGGNIGKI